MDADIEYKVVLRLSVLALIGVAISIGILLHTDYVIGKEIENNPTTTNIMILSVEEVIIKKVTLGSDRFDQLKVNVLYWENGTLKTYELSTQYNEISVCVSVPPIEVFMPDGRKGLNFANAKDCSPLHYIEKTISCINKQESSWNPLLKKKEEYCREKLILYVLPNELLGKIVNELEV